jgi:D-alanyl-D-alanine carboxypeptidase/D-alanyl-D-alanine-endopeptidase (penicillin-binding protein 4)
MRIELRVAVVAAAAAGAAVAGWGADRDRLLFHAETLGGEEVASQGADLPFNPASLVKVGTTLWALESLGRDHRYDTRFGIDGDWQPASGRVVGSLVVDGGGDPDFQPENLFLVARRLNEMGVRRVEGWLRVDDDFWIGWENGHEHAVDAAERAHTMGRRVRQMLDPRRWDRSTRASWNGLCERRGWDSTRPPRVEIVGTVEAGVPADWTPLLTHRSNPLPVLLRRFNVYSNNDIIRIAEGLGGADELEAYLVERLGDPPAVIELETASGERINRLTARSGVRLVRAFLETAAGDGLSPSKLLPVIGCDPGSTDRKFPALARTERAGSVTVKTGTLTETDGGVAVLGGLYTSSAREIVIFCVAAPRSGRDELRWRSLQQAWLLDLIESTGGAVQRPCGPELPYSDTFAVIETAGR